MKLNYFGLLYRSLTSSTCERTLLETKLIFFFYRKSVTYRHYITLRSNFFFDLKLAQLAKKIIQLLCNLNAVCRIHSRSCL